MFLSNKESICIHTFSGIAFDLLNPQPEMILMEDIAHSLAIINRSNGAAKFPYSVAQHSLYVLCRKLVCLLNSNSTVFCTTQRKYMSVSGFYMDSTCGTNSVQSVPKQGSVRRTALGINLKQSVYLSIMPPTEFCERSG